MDPVEEKKAAPKAIARDIDPPVVVPPVTKPVSAWAKQKGHTGRQAWVFVGAKSISNWSCDPQTDETYICEADYDAAVDAALNIRIG